VKQAPRHHDTTLFDGADPKSVRAFFDEMMELASKA